MKLLALMLPFCFIFSGCAAESDYKPNTLEGANCKAQCAKSKANCLDSSYVCDRAAYTCMTICKEKDNTKE
jgi:hypothetical protein